MSFYKEYCIKFVNPEDDAETETFFFTKAVSESKAYDALYLQHPDCCALEIREIGGN